MSDTSKYYVDFSSYVNLTYEQKEELKRIQNEYLPLERVELLDDFRNNNIITSDDYETMTGLPYIF